jgi:hypothetical protein
MSLRMRISAAFLLQECGKKKADQTNVQFHYYAFKIEL